MNYLKKAARGLFLSATWFALTPAFAQPQLPTPQQASLIVPCPAGSAFDITARQIQPELSRVLNTTITAENIGGASGSIGAQKLLSADPNHLNMLLGSPNELALPPLMLSGVKYKPEDAPDAHAGEVPVAYVVLKADATVTAEDVIAHAIQRVLERAAVLKHERMFVAALSMAQLVEGVAMKATDRGSSGFHVDVQVPAGLEGDVLLAEALRSFTIPYAIRAN